jgi:hypothetical protein
VDLVRQQLSLGKGLHAVGLALISAAMEGGSQDNISVTVIVLGQVQ